MTNRRRWTGGEGAGSPTFKPAEKERVIRAMAGHIGRSHRTSQSRLAVEVDLDGRTVRAILSQIDGVIYVLVTPSNGELYVAEWYEDAERTTRQLRSRARKMNERSDRRDLMAPDLPRRQGVFEFEPEEELDEGDDL